MSKETRISINLTQFVSRKEKDERSAKIYENWHQLINMKKQRKEPTKNQEIQQKPRASTPNQKNLENADVIKDIMNMKLRLHFIA